jgi:hypothetical protein
MKDTLLGNWAGTNLLNLSWLPSPEHLSDTTLQVTKSVNDNFLQLTYTWSDTSHENTPHNGVLLLGVDPETRKATSAWCDSWHQSTGLLFCTGDIEASGKINVLGSYSAPPGPDWGWRISLQQNTDDTLEIVMTNITPDGEEDLAVRATFRRVSK